jgi:hypothetical protein
MATQPEIQREQRSPRGSKWYLFAAIVLLALAAMRGVRVWFDATQGWWQIVVTVGFVLWAASNFVLYWRPPTGTKEVIHAEGVRSAGSARNITA